MMYVNQNVGLISSVVLSLVFIPLYTSLLFPCSWSSQRCGLINSLHKIIFSFFVYFFQAGKGWLRDMPEDLDMFIAQRDFERAMELIDRSE